MNKAVFLDRDGVLSKELGRFTTSAEEFEINPGVAEALRSFRDTGFMLIVITNQSGIARGLYSVNELERMHEKLINYLAAEQISIDEIYYCPHHPVMSKCLCRKPGSLMLEKAIARFGIDASRSYFIGDNERDEVAARAAGVIPVRIAANQDLRIISLP